MDEREATDLSRFDLAKEMINVCKNGEHHLFLGHSERGVSLGRRRMGTVVDDSVHVETESHTDEDSKSHSSAR
jgi:hypothetical protein